MPVWPLATESQCLLPKSLSRRVLNSICTMEVGLPPLPASGGETEENTSAVKNAPIQRKGITCTIIKSDYVSI